MAVDTTHPEYDLRVEDWQTCRDAAAGQRAIHNAGDRYLPMLGGQDSDEYEAYKLRALFYEATPKTISGLTGMIFRKPAQKELGGMTDFVADVTTTGVSLDAFSKSLVGDVLTVGRAGILVDFTKINTSNMTAEEARAAGARPFLKHYQAGSIFNWIEGKEVRLKEIYTEKTSKEFEIVTGEQIRVLEIVDGLYQQRIFREETSVGNVKKWVEYETIIPIVNGKRLKFIPFVFAGVEGMQGEVEEPPLMGLVNVNISHYRNSADLEHGAHYTGLPQPWIAGVNDMDVEGKKRTWKIGSSNAWAFTNENAQAKYLEFEGKGLDSLSELMKAKEEKMAALGAQMLTPSARRNESTDTAEIRHMGENSILSSLSETISAALNKALEFAALWLGVTPATIKLNTDFMAQSMTPQMLTALVKAWVDGGISEETLFENLKQGEIINSEKSFEEEKSEKQTNDVIL